MELFYSLIILLSFSLYVIGQAAITRLFTYGFDSINGPISKALYALPYNSEDGATYEITPVNEMVTVNKYNGRLSMASTSPSSPISYTIRHTFKGATKDTVISIGFSATSDPNVGIVSYLQVGYFESFQFVKDVPLVLPNYLDGVPASCTVSPPLPTGLVYDTNGLSGAPLEVSDTIEDYTFQCINSVSSTNKVVFRSKVHATLLQGIVVTFFRSIGPNRLSCSFNAPMNAFHTKDVRIEIQKADTHVGHSYLGSDVTPWDTQSDLWLDWGASWTGFIYIDTAGDYVFGTETDDGNWIFIDGVMIMDVSGCRAYQPRVDTQPYPLTRGYHYLVINYFQAGGPNALILFWKRPGTTNMVEIPDNVFFYTPKYVFEYSQIYASYNWNTKGISLTPTFYGVPSTGYKFTINPAISSIGLSINSDNGHITGDISGDTQNVDTEYTVTATSSSTSFTTKLYIDVKYPYQPFHKYFSWAHGVNYVRPLDQGVTIFPNNHIDWRVKYLGRISNTMVDTLDYPHSISFPPGSGQQIHFDNKNCGTGVIGFWVLVEKTWNDTNVTLTAYHADGSGTTKFDITMRSIEVCPEERVRLEIFGYGYAQQSDTGFVFEVKDVGSRVVFGASVKQSGFDGRLGNCVVPGTYTVTGVYDNDLISDRPRLEIWVEKVYYTTIYGSAKSFSGSFVVGSVFCPAITIGSYVFASVPIGSLSVRPCYSNQIGINAVQCAFVRNVPGWFNIVDTCRNKTQPTKISYGSDRITVRTGVAFTIRPIVDGDIDSYTVNPQFTDIGFMLNNLTGVITLMPTSTSRATYTIFGYYNNLPFTTTLIIEAISSSLSSNSLVGLKFGYDNSFRLVANAPIYYPFIFTSGTNAVCTCTTLPAGINIKNGGIFGSITKTSTAVEHTISCSNSVSSLSVKVKTDVKDIFVPGLIATYGKLKTGTVGCSSEYNPFKTPNTDIGFQRIEDNVNHGYINSFIPWNGLTTDYREQFYVNLRFYLKVDVTGVYSFELSAEKGAIMYLDGGEFINNGGCHDFNSKTNEITLGIGHTLIEISYWNTVGGSGLVLKWKIPSSENFVVIPSSNIFHVPSSELTYKYQKASYVINNNIEINPPILYGITSSSFSINPVLPTGLNFDTNTGTISGTPIVHTNGTIIPYYITTTYGSNIKITTKILFDIIDYQPPFDFEIRYTGSTKGIVGDVMMFPGNQISLAVSVSGNVNRYLIVPDLPSGFSFNENTGVFTGTCSDEFDITFNVGAINSGGLANTTFRLFCSTTCPGTNEEPIGIEIANNNALRFHYEINFKVGSKTYTISKPFLETPSFYSVCFPVSGQSETMSIVGANKNLYPIRMVFYLITQKFSEITSLVGGGEFSTPFDRTVQLTFQAPTLSITDQEYTSNANDYFSIPVIVSGVFTRVSITPTLPSGITLNTRTLEISGYPLFRTTSTRYTLTVGTSQGQASQSFSIRITDCESTGQYPINVIFTANINPVGNQVKIKKGSDEILYLMMTNNGTSSKQACTSDLSGFTIELESTSNLPWGNNYYVQVLLANVDLGTYRMTSNQYKQTFSLPSITFAIDPLQEWSYADTTPGANWQYPNFTDTGMSKSLLYNIQQFSATTKYLRSNIKHTSSRNTVAMELKFRHLSGVIMYLNGFEVYRRFMPSGVVTTNTLATGQFSIMTEVSLLLPYTLFNNANTNIVSFEFHKYQTTESVFDLSCSSNYLITEECIDLTTRSTIVVSSGKADENNPVLNAIDNDPSTSWIELVSLSGTNPSVELTFGSNKFLWFDTYGVMSSQDAMSYKSKNPKQLQLQVKGVNGFYESLSLFDVNIVADNQPVTTKLYDDFKLVNTVKFIITERVNPTSDASVADLLLQACHKAYCSSTGKYPATLMDITANVTCDDGYIGYELRKCRNSYYPNWDRADLTNCLPGPPTKLVYENQQYTFYKGNNITETIIPSIKSIGSVTFEISPVLPLGLVFNTASGQISGFPNEKSNARLYTVTAKNVRGTTTAQIYITVFAYECSAQGFWPNTERGTKAEIDCSNGYIGKRTRECLNLENPEWAKPNLDTCQIVRRPGVASKGERQLHGTILLSYMPTSIDVDDIFFDFFRIEFVKVMPIVEANNIILIRQNTRQIQDDVTLDIYLGVNVENYDELFTNIIPIFQAPYTFASNLGNVIGGPGINLQYNFVDSFDYIPDETDNTLVIALSVTFGLLFAILVTTCVWIRCKNRKTKTRSGSVKLKSGGGAAASTTKASGSSGRSVRAGAGSGEKRSVRI